MASDSRADVERHTEVADKTGIRADPGGMSSGQQTAVEKIAKSNPNLPRKLRARVEGQTMDPVPDGMHMSTSHDHRLVANEPPEETGKPLELSRRDKAERLDHMKEVAMAHETDKHSLGRSGAVQSGDRRTTPPGQRVYPKTMQSKANQLMDSRHRGAGDDTGAGGVSNRAAKWGGSKMPSNQ